MWERHVSKFKTIILLYVGLLMRGKFPQIFSEFIGF